MRIATRTVIGLGVLLLASGEVRAGGPAKFMMAAQVNGRLLEGQPLAWSKEQMLLLGRDGVLYDFAPDAAQDSRKTATSFRGYSIGEMRNRLRVEFQGDFEVHTTTHFVVVHPRGPWSAWADRLELLYRRFTRYMRVRGFAVQPPQVPLVAIVFRNRTDYHRHAAAGGTPQQPETLGHYDPKSNRIFLFDATGSSGNAEWSSNAATIIHEATHQTAYNVGIHRRFAPQPRWLVEGLAMMFEARGVWDARSVDTQSDRLNRGRLNAVRHGWEHRQSDTLIQLVATDQLFRTNTGAAYAEAWALSFYLCESRPQDYCNYLARVAARKTFSTYSARDRLADFASIFGSDFELLDAQYGRFLEELK